MTSDRSEELFQFFKSHIGKSYPDDFITFGKWLEPIVRVVERDRLVLEFVGRKEQANPTGNIHGGIIAALIDETIGAMMFYIGEPHFKSSINLSVNFLSGCRPEDVLLVDARVVKSGRTLTFGQATITRKDDSKLIATGSCNFIITTAKL